MAKLRFADTVKLSIADLGAALLRCLPAEVAHDFALAAIRAGALRLLPEPRFASAPIPLRTQVPGWGELRHPIGLAAGFDKNALMAPALLRLGFSFLEVGTLTPKPQAGNPKPRLFRQADQHGLINRMGFNNLGAESAAARIKAMRWRHDVTPLGINVGKNQATPLESALTDYLQGFDRFADLGHYLVANISSPNTKGLRSLAQPDFIDQLADLAGKRRSKVWIKLDPDMDRTAFQTLVAAIAKAKFAGIILTNTHALKFPEMGGQSGHPLSIASTIRLEWAYAVHRGELPMIGSGGVLSGQDAYQKIIRGAAAVQVYSGLIYRGPWAVFKILQELTHELQLNGFACLADAVNSYYDR